MLGRQVSERQIFKVIHLLHSLSPRVSQKCLPSSDCLLGYRWMYLLILVPTKSWITVGNGEGLFLPLWEAGVHDFRSPFPLQFLWNVTKHFLKSLDLSQELISLSQWLIRWAVSGYLANDKLQGALLAEHINTANQLQNRMGIGQWRQEQEIILGNLIDREREAIITIIRWNELTHLRLTIRLKNTRLPNIMRGIW